MGKEKALVSGQSDCNSTQNILFLSILFSVRTHQVFAEGMTEVSSVHDKEGKMVFISRTDT